MKNTILVILFITALIHQSFSQVLVNNGATISIQNGSSLVIAGDMNNLSGGDFNNSGSIKILGDWINGDASELDLQNTTGEILFDGQIIQHISGTQTNFSNVRLSNNVELDSETSVSSILALDTAYLRLGDFDLTMGTASEISGASKIAHIKAYGNGKLFREVGVDTIGFPLGNSMAYVPLELKNNGASDYFGINVIEGVLVDGTSGNTIPEIDHCVNNTWTISEQLAGGSDLTVTASWEPQIEGASFDRTFCGLGVFANSTWQPISGSAATASDLFSVNRGGISDFTAFSVGDTLSPMAISLRLTLDIHAFLEGPFNGVDMDGHPELVQGWPLVQPYNTEPWFYTGTESVVSIPNANVVDWVLIELRDTTGAALATGETMIARQAAFLLNDGSIVSTDGASNIQFDAEVSNQLFVIVWHRNHLGIMSAFPLTKSGGVYTYDFTINDNQAFGTDSQKELATEKWGMPGGDGDKNGNIGLDDKILVWETQAGENGYLNGDYNMDSEVSNQDKNSVWEQNRTLSSQVPE